MKKSNPIEMERRIVHFITVSAMFALPLLLPDLMLVSYVYPEGWPDPHHMISLPDIQIVSHDLLRDHFAAIIGLPMAAIVSLWVVAILRPRYGAINFDVLGIRFRGASGPVVMWILCFLVVVFAIRLLC